MTNRQMLDLPTTYQVVELAALYKKLQAPIPRRLRIKCLSQVLSTLRLRSIHAIGTAYRIVLTKYEQ